MHPDMGMLHHCTILFVGLTLQSVRHATMDASSRRPLGSRRCQLVYIFQNFELNSTKLNAQLTLQPSQADLHIV